MDYPGWESLCESFADVAGMPLNNSPKKATWSDSNRKPRRGAEQLATCINDLLAELLNTRKSLRQREAELAAGVSIGHRPDEETHLVYRLEAVLRAGAEAVGCQAAALYLLDETTSHLKLRAGWGLSDELYQEPARPLRGAVADLEALIGHAVVLEDTSLLPNWQPPLEFASAVCVPVATPTTILGTLWILGDETRNYSGEQTNMIEIVAGRVATDLEREILLHKSVDTRELDREVAQAAVWQEQRLPTIAPLLDQWEVAGWTSHSDCLNRGFYDWNVLQDSRLAVMVGEGQGPSLEAGLTATALHTAVRSLGTYPHTAKQLVDRVNENFWTSSTGGQFASLGYALIEPEKNSYEIVCAGHVGAVIIRSDVTDVAAKQNVPLGVQPDTEYAEFAGGLVRRDVLIIFSEGIRRVFETTEDKSAEEEIATVLRDDMTESAEQVVATLREVVESFTPARPIVDKSILVVRRR